MWLLRTQEESRLLISMLASLIVVASRMHNTLSLTLLRVKFAPRAILILSDSLLEVNDRLIKHSKFAELSTGKGTLPLSCQSQQIGQRSKLHCWALKNTRN
ncbi:uncharacterized protein [Populus alba]|uniref:uncharacterized protein isoform X2 n=1 Tax=Populus alba TaxID=43335 RepID=UPI00158CF3A1|nr:uncharacterized protein LOC118061998 isoform X2 [Populus alba]XP_034931553.1 uncharacterized protein LOC118061998 isoform X2 [Populus alba]XP_034931555.1 uncharacterized protein LOC118061998 isoform X2 [Populus alba]